MAAIAVTRAPELLAASSDNSAQQATELAEEAARFIREKRIKGISVAQSAEKLAKLIQQRDSEANTP
ncbi:MAG: hypothetical protein ACYTEL_08500 [Planctomycetota bacterium]|jgi:hypothetical protein